jgi:hypothetical protein
MTIVVRELILKVEINSQAGKQAVSLSETQLKALKKDVLAETLRSMKKAERHGFNR